MTKIGYCYRRSPDAAYRGAERIERGIYRLNRTRIRQFTNWIGMLACLLVGPEGVGHAVFCFGTDGHLSVEAATDGRGARFTMATSQASAGSSLKRSSLATAEHCGSCIDIAIGSNSRKQYLTSRRDRSPRLEAGSLAVCSYLAAVIADPPIESLFSAQPFTGNSILDSLQTVILLI